MSLDCSLIFAQKRVNLTSKCEHDKNVSMSNNLEKHLLKLIEYNASLWLDLEVMFDSTNDKKTSYSKMFLKQSNLFICQKSCKKWTLSVQNLNCQSKIQQWLKQKRKRVRIWDLHRSTDRRKLSWRSESERRVICWDAQDVSQRSTWIQQHLKSAEFSKSSYTDTWVSEKKRYFTSYEQWSDHADWNSKFLFYRKIRFCISDLIRLTAKFHDDVHHRIFEILHTFAEHASRRFHSTEFSSSSKRDSTSKISCSTTRAHFLSTRMNFEQLWNVSQWW